MDTAPRIKHVTTIGLNTTIELAHAGATWEVYFRRGVHTEIYCKSNPHFEGYCPVPVLNAAKQRMSA